MNYPRSTEPTRYELIAEDLREVPAGGRVARVCYVAGSPSFSALMRALMAIRGQIVSRYGLNESDGPSTGNRGRRATLEIPGKVRFRFSGRTQREAIAEKSELPYCLDGWAASPSDEEA